MPTNTLTDQKCRTAKPGPKPQKLFDGHGLYLSVSPAGGKVWRVAYRLDGKPQTATIGAYPLFSLAEARAKRDEIRKGLAEGVKPGVRRVAAAPTLLEASTTYWAGRGDVSDSYRDNALRGIELHLGPALGDKSVATITHTELLAELMRMNAAKKFVYLRKVRVWVGQVFDWAMAQGYLPDSQGAVPDVLDFRDSAATGNRGGYAKESDLKKTASGDFGADPKALAREIRQAEADLLKVKDEASRKLLLDHISVLKNQSERFGVNAQPSAPPARKSVPKMTDAAPAQQPAPATTAVPAVSMLERIARARRQAYEGLDRISSR